MENSTTCNGIELNINSQYWDGKLRMHQYWIDFSTRQQRDSIKFPNDIQEIHNEFAKYANIAKSFQLTFQKCISLPMKCAMMYRNNKHKKIK